MKLQVRNSVSGINYRHSRYVLLIGDQEVANTGMGPVAPYALP